MFEGGGGEASRSCRGLRGGAKEKKLGEAASLSSLPPATWGGGVPYDPEVPVAPYYCNPRDLLLMLGLGTFFWENLP